MTAATKTSSAVTRRIDHIVIHCSASPNGGGIGAEHLDQWHRQRGFMRNLSWRSRFNSLLGYIGYHFCITANGSVQEGRHLDEIGAHVQGRNSNTVGICLIGTDEFTIDAWHSLALTVRDVINNVLGLSIESPSEAVAAAARAGVRVVGHRDLSEDKNGDGIIQKSEWMKVCPGFDVGSWVAGGMEPLKGHIFGDK